MALSRTTSLNRKGRRRAVFLCVGVCFLIFGLAGCSNLDGHPLLSTLGALVPGKTDVSKAAANVSYASINFSLGRRNGLLILSEQKPGLTFWQSSQSETVVLRHGYLQSTSGLKPELAMTRITGLANDAAGQIPWSKALVSPIEYRVLRAWKSTDDRLDSETAQARLTCPEGLEKVKLPLATLSLRRCREVLDWDSGQTTRSTYWIDPKDGRIWAADTVPWPGAEAFDWQVARPWW